MNAYSDITIQNFLKALVFTKNKEYIGFNYAYWSLLYEGIFYLLIPFIKRFQRQYFMVSGLLYLAGVFITSFYKVENPFLKFVLEYNFYFAIGQAIYYYRNSIMEKLRSRNFKWLLMIPAIILFFLFDLLAIIHYEIGANLIAAIFGGLMLLLFLNYNFANNFFIKGIKKLGEISYSLYLIHIPVLIFIYTLLHNITGQTVFYSRIYFMAVVLCVICGFVFYKLIEEPSLALIKKVKNHYKLHPQKARQTFTLDAIG